MPKITIRIFAMILLACLLMDRSLVSGCVIHGRLESSPRDLGGLFQVQTLGGRNALWRREIVGKFLQFKKSLWSELRPSSSRMLHWWEMFNQPFAAYRSETRFLFAVSTLRNAIAIPAAVYNLVQAHGRAVWAPLLILIVTGADLLWWKDFEQRFGGKAGSTAPARAPDTPEARLIFRVGILYGALWALWTIGVMFWSASIVIPWLLGAVYVPRLFSRRSA